MCENSLAHAELKTSPATTREQNIVGNLRAVRKGIENLKSELGALEFLVDALERAALN